MIRENRSGTCAGQSRVQFHPLRRFEKTIVRPSQALVNLARYNNLTNEEGQARLPLIALWHLPYSLYSACFLPLITPRTELDGVFKFQRFQVTSHIIGMLTRTIKLMEPDPCNTTQRKKVVAPVAPEEWHQTGVRLRWKATRDEVAGAQKGTWQQI